MKITRCVFSWSLFALAPGLAAPEPVHVPDAPVFRASFSSVAAYSEQIIVVPEPEDRGPATKSRWVKFEEALGPGRSARRTVTSWCNNDGTRTECYAPCNNLCCTHSGGFSLHGAGFGSK